MYAHRRFSWWTKTSNRRIFNNWSDLRCPLILIPLDTYGTSLDAHRSASRTIACIPPTRKKLLSAAISIGEKIMNDAAKGIRQLKKSIHGTVNCGVSVDGTWQRRGFSSLNGCVSAISVDTGKIIDFETLSQFCRKCNSKMEQ
ncbi:uncharacterized protein TNCV_38571 [Trichonephila clavipes]|nr:uncharacterized protein TNCV_38571 [Trichonephila clavipes]